MLSIAIYSDKPDDIASLRSIIQDFLIELKIVAKVSSFMTSYELVTVPCSYDMYIMDMDSEEDSIALGQQMMEIDPGSHYIYISSDIHKAYQAAEICADYFLAKPIQPEKFIRILKEIKKEIQDDNIIIKIPSGERRIRVNNLNYINIVKRCLCYHLKDGNMFDGQTLRSSFEKAIDPLQKNKSFLFLPPSLLINVGEIKIINKDNIIFENDDVLYFPQKSYETVRNAWINYNRIIE